MAAAQIRLMVVPSPDPISERSAHSLPTGELITQAHLHRTPRDVRVVLQKLISEGTKARRHEGTKGEESASASVPSCLGASVPSSVPFNLDDAYLSGILHELVDKNSA